jgi:hypothetical protein
MIVGGFILGELSSVNKKRATSADAKVTLFMFKVYENTP